MGNEEFGKEETAGGNFSEVGCKVGEPKCKDTGCRGSATTPAAPTAPKGVLCVYTAEEQSFEVGGAHLEAQLLPAFEGNAYGPSGAYLSGFFAQKPTASASARGTWAVTAP